MKYPEHRMSLEAAMPLSDSILSWLGHQLELRGIDSVIYTRYIISLLQQDVAEIDSADREGFWDRKTDAKKCKDKKDGKKKPVNEEERRKNAAVECLLSVSDGDHDIENLVEELFIRLKESKSSRGYFTPLSIHTKDDSKLKTNDCQDPAERYYAAFPALPGDGTPPQTSPSSDDNIWRRNRKSGSLAGETSGSKEGSPQNLPSGLKEDNGSAKEVKSLEKKSVAESKSSSSSPAGTDKRKKAGKADASQKLTPNGGGKKKTAGMKAKKEVEGHSKAVRFLSWPPPGHGKRDHSKYETEKGKDGKSAETEEEKYCSMVEQMLKEMLLSGNKHVQAAAHLPVLAYFPEEGFTEHCFTEWFREDSQSPEFTENDDWYTQPLEHIFYTPVSQTKRLYKRHSYPPTLLNFDEDVEWSSLVTEQLLCLKRASQEYILVGDVFNPGKANIESNPEETRDDLSESFNEDATAGEDPEKDTVEDTDQTSVVLDSESAESFSEDKLLENDLKEEEHGEESSSLKEVMPLWFDDTQVSQSDPFNFDQPNFVDFSSYQVDGKSVMNSNPSALPLTLQCPFPGIDPECLVPASDTSSPVSSVEKGYFSDVTETSYVFDMSRHSSPFPDMLLLMNYGEDEEAGDITSTANSLKGSRLESLFESSRHELQDGNMNKSELFEVQRGVQSETKPEFDFCADDLFPYIPEEENCVSCGTRNMFPNGAGSNENPPGKQGLAETNLETEAEAEDNSESVSLSQHGSQLQLSSSASEERDESACFPSDLFNSFSSVGDSSGSSVFTESALVDHHYVLDLIDTGEVDLQNECQSSLLFHLSPITGSGGSCWQSKILLHDYGGNVSFGDLRQSAGLDWDSVLNQKKKHIWTSVMNRSPAVELSVGSPTLQRELWQLWDVNVQKKVTDLWQRAPDTNIWNSILNLSVYSPGKLDEETGWTHDEEVYFTDIINEEDAVLGLQFLEEINGYGCKGPRYERSVSESDLNSMTNNLFLDVSKPNLDISYELIPSENSAFQGVVPKQLHHVRSAPNLRYKSLASMLPDSDLQPIGLATVESPVEHLYFSAKTHFRPIQTPVATPDEDVDVQPQDLFGGMSGNTGTPYQQFVNPGEEETKFRPKFKIQKDLDKYIQTGGSLDETDVDYERLKQYQLEQAKDTRTEFIEEVVGAVLEETAELIVKAENWSKVPLPESNTENSKYCKHVKSLDDLRVLEEEQAVLNLCENLTDLCTNSEEEERNRETEQIQDVDSVKVLDDPKWDGQRIKEMHFSDQMKDYHDIWSSGYEMDLHPFSVENECLFLPCTVDERLCNSEVTTRDEEESRDEEKCDHSDELYFYYLDSYPEVDSYILSTCSDDCSEQQNYEVSGLIPIPHQAVYSSDLEKQWLERKALSGKYSKKKSHRLKLRRDSSRRKPCSFFLEGNCRRSDCKFSHDLSSITCRFWEEGLCFKGTLCPFFHGYLSDSELGGSHSGKTGDRFEYRKDDFPELDNFGKMKHKDSHSQKISWKRQAHKEFLKKTLSSRKKNRPSTKQLTRPIESSSC